jgi:carbamate kinase
MVAVGGGGIPVVEKENGNLRGVEAVIDKDFASGLLANLINADLLLISTAVEKVAVNFNKPDQKWLDEMTVAEAEEYIREGHFAPGSMLPKIQAIVKFLKEGGKKALVTDPPNIQRALRGETGTWIVP